MNAPWPVLQQVLASRRSEEDAIVWAIAGAAFVAAVACVVFGVKLYRRKKVGLAVLVFLIGALALFTCVGLSALLFVAQFAWH